MSEKLSEDEAEALKQVEQKLANSRREQGIQPEPEPKALKPRLPEVVSDEELSRRKSEREKREKEIAEHDRKVRLDSFAAVCGRRYATCTLDNFIAETAEQREIVSELRGYKASLRERIKAGVNLILFGPKGTGKDHLLVALAREAIAIGAELVWWNGMDLFGEVRDRINRDQDERDFIKRLAEPHILFISDPLPPVGTLTEFQIQTLFRILDARYRAMRPVWCSVNVAGPEEAESRLSPQCADRLRDGAIALYCNWPSYRKVCQ